jgi:hypothetical protein
MSFSKLPRIDEINILLGNSFQHLRPEATAIVADPIDTGRIDEDLDYLIAKRIATLEGWQAFLVAHAGGARAESAEAEIDKLSLLVKATEPAAAERSERASSEAKVESEIAGPPLPLEAAAPLDVVCNHVVDSVGEPRCDRSGNESAHITSDSEPGRLRPQVASLTDRLAISQPTSPARADKATGEKPRATALRRATTVSANFIPVQRKRSCAFGFACHWRAQSLPPILLALLGVKTKHPTKAYGQVFADARPGNLRGR